MSIIEDGQEIALSGGGARAGAALNPGSVGQPRDHDPRASCGVYDSDKKTFRVARLRYDLAATQAKIRAAGLPDFLAARLESGR
ncbi:MAG: hypothetical protein KGJ13_02360 [Patescibacteria group bacterium]|nr:hypothetical protein [Patescibacteria group bacterium]